MDYSSYPLAHFYFNMRQSASIPINSIAKERPRCGLCIISSPSSKRNTWWLPTCSNDVGTRQTADRLIASERVVKEG